MLKALCASVILAFTLSMPALAGDASGALAPKAPMAEKKPAQGKKIHKAKKKVAKKGHKRPAKKRKH